MNLNIGIATAGIENKTGSVYSAVVFCEDKVLKELDALPEKTYNNMNLKAFVENLTQVEMAKWTKMTQSDISQIENGTRNIGRKVAQRIEKLFDVDYRSFLE